MSSRSWSRREAVEAIAAGVASLCVLALAPHRPLAACAHDASHTAASLGPHPVPRPGIDASRVLDASALGDAPADVIAAFDEVRRIPQVVDGIRCNCGCADQASNYSLLSCYEGEGMARHCGICQGQARLAYRLHQAGKSLDEIRDAIDARYA